MLGRDDLSIRGRERGGGIFVLDTSVKLGPWLSFTGRWIDGGPLIAVLLLLSIFETSLNLLLRFLWGSNFIFL